jgi:hypothetical protein
VSRNTEPKYAPGSEAAIQNGCTCPVIDNGHGRGYMGISDVYVHSGDCPLHGHYVVVPPHLPNQGEKE